MSEGRGSWYGWVREEDERTTYFPSLSLDSVLGVIVTPSGEANKALESINTHEYGKGFVCKTWEDLKESC